VQDPIAAQAPDIDGEVIEVRLPAAPTHLPVLRTFTADLAARLDFNLDEVADLRMAVDEACSGLVARAVAASKLTCTFRLEDDALWVVAAAQTTDGAPPARDTFGWQVLTALVDDVDTDADGAGLVTVKLYKRRTGTAA
jgi:serine/threonine-protein kinase RsbW